MWAVEKKSVWKKQVFCFFYLNQDNIEKNKHGFSGEICCDATNLQWGKCFLKSTPWREIMRRFWERKFIGHLCLFRDLKAKASDIDFFTAASCWWCHHVHLSCGTHRDNSCSILAWYRLRAVVTTLGCGSWRPWFTSHSNPNKFPCIFLDATHLMLAPLSFLRLSGVVRTAAPLLFSSLR